MWFYHARGIFNKSVFLFVFIVCVSLHLRFIRTFSLMEHTEVCVEKCLDATTDFAITRSIVITLRFDISDKEERY